MELYLLSSQPIKFRKPVLTDGMSVYQLIQSCPPLDTNSSYCNFLQCGHFSSTSVAAERDGELVGFISGYIVPERPDTLFIWQVAVDKQARGLGLASKMLTQLLNRDICNDVHFLETTITEDNLPSWNLFKRLAKHIDAELQSAVWLDKQIHFNDQHDSESLVRLGPFNLEVTRDL